ncbi:MAG: HesA/MoeB/ThiF family protein [Firmicutes bacterium]|nr:HesA/MoeB/ThiF family protein [Bacillota bacterium]
MIADKAKEMIKRAARRETAPTGVSCCLLPFGDLLLLSRKLKLSRRDLEIAALEVGVIPERYHRHIGLIGIAGQLKLLRSRVGLAGAGGLGGYAVELLARSGIGSLIVIDDDCFTAGNLNRQLQASESTLGMSKAEEAVRRVREINGAVEAAAHRCRGSASNWPRLLRGCNLVLDCLDNLPSRFALEEACQELAIPLVHGAIDGFMGQVAVIRPGQPLLATIYGQRGGQRTDRGGAAETLSFTPSLVAAQQTAEAVKLLAGFDRTDETVLLLIDLFSGEVARIALTPG